jgi:hypothetical protein
VRNALLLFAVLTIFATPSRGQTGSNCSYGSYTFAGGGTNVPQCYPTQAPSIVTTTATYNEYCNGTTDANIGTAQYYSGTSTVTGTGQNECFLLKSPTVCYPVMQFQETDGISPSDYNRFYNRAYNSAVNVGGLTPCKQVSMNQDFRQCIGQACSIPYSGGYPCQYDCPYPLDGSCNPCGQSPIILDINNHGFDLTNAAGGVLFDMLGTGHPVRMGWTAPGSDNAFLCLPDPNGKCDDGADLFGNYTPQPASLHPNGFAALAVYDDPSKGGNGDGVIDTRDAIFSSLRLWVDANHDGISQPNELHTLPSLGVNSISLHYELSKKTDQYGNRFRYRAAVNPDDPDASHVDRVAYDVFFVTTPNSPDSTKNFLNPPSNRTCVVPTSTTKGMLTGRR